MKKFILCTTCWQKSSNSNPSIYGEVLPGGDLRIIRNGLNVLLSGERFSLTCNKCGTSLYEKFELVQEIEFEKEKLRVKKFFFAGEILGGTA